jgi:hypothetical protein
MTPCARCSDIFPRAALTEYRGALLCPRDLYNLALEQMSHRSINVPTAAVAPAPIATRPERTSPVGNSQRPIGRYRDVETVTTKAGLV